MIDIENMFKYQGKTTKVIGSSRTKTYKEIYDNFSYIKKYWIVISLMGVISISTFNSVVYVALTLTQVINAVLVLSAIPAVTIIISSMMNVDKTNKYQLTGLLLSVIGICVIISNADILKIINLSFNKGDLWMLVCVITWSPVSYTHLTLPTNREV